MKNCRKCEVELVVGENWTPSREKKRDYACSPCVKLYNKKYATDNIEDLKSKQFQYRIANVEKISARNREKYEGNSQYFKDRSREYRKENPEKAAAAVARWVKANLGRSNAIKRRYQLLKLAQTPSWYCHETVSAIYEIAAEMGYEVDHIVPLSKGGLHSHENMQLLTRSENASKGAKESG